LRHRPLNGPKGIVLGHDPDRTTVLLSADTGLSSLFCRDLTMILSRTKGIGVN
jgi:hypothetical protein